MSQQHTEEFESCVRQVTQQVGEESRAFAICTSSFQEAGKPIKKCEHYDRLPEESTVISSQNLLTGYFTKVSTDERIIAGYASTPDLDEQGDVVPINVIRDALPEYMKNPIIRFMHDKPVGLGLVSWTHPASQKMYATAVDDNGVFLVGRISKGATDVWTMIEEGVLKGYSIGGKLLLKSRVCKADHVCYTQYEKMRWKETSVVDIPMNNHTLFHIIKSLGMVPDIAKAEHSQYINPDGTFVGGIEGCKAYMMNVKGLPAENADQLCKFMGREAVKI